ncbi:MAG: PorV/PorQ family protein [Bacteroidetes bacterium]|nr:PorV/PorQ family protein [Bacteroidota bacterium]
MKNIFRYFLAFVMTGAILLPAKQAVAGNKDRSGSAGAPELLINPWARCTGWGGANTATVRGLEATFGNVAGIAFTQRSEFIFSHTNWFQGSGVSINSFGFTQKVGESGVLGMAIMSMRFGEIEKTTTESPDPSLGSIGTFSPNFLNIGISYSKAFSNAIYGGINVKIINEAIADVNAQGVSIDAGIQYVTGDREEIKFGISLKNVGPTMKFKGDGMSFRGFIPGMETQSTIEQRSQAFELPAQLNIGAAYDFKFSEIHRLTLAGNFTSNSFAKDQFVLGAEYGFASYLMLRAGYTYEEGIFEKKNRTTAYTGPSAGLTVEIPFNKEKGSSFAVDFSYRATDPFSGTYCFGARINL